MRALLSAALFVAVIATLAIGVFATPNIDKGHGVALAAAVASVQVPQLAPQLTFGNPGGIFDMSAFVVCLAAVLVVMLPSALSTLNRSTFTGAITGIVRAVLGSTVELLRAGLRQPSALRS